MTWSDVIQAPKPRVVRQFGVVCLVVLAGAGLYLALARGRTVTGYSLIGLGVLSAVLGLAAPGLFRWVFTGAMMVAFPIGFVVSQVMLAFLFFGVFLVVGAFLRLRGWDGLHLRRRPAGASYWDDKQPPPDPGRYLKQY